MLLSTTQIEQSAKRFATVENLKSRDLTGDLSKEVFIDNVPPEITRGNILDADDNLAKRKEMLESLNQEPVEFAFERAIGKNDSVYSNFVELIHQAKQKVGRIAIKRGNRNIGFATGFMVSENLLLTNWHVFKTIDEVADSEIQFFYEYNSFGTPGTPVAFKLQAGLFFHSNEELDYCFVGVSAKDVTNNHGLSEIGYIFLDPALGKLGHEGQEALNIIHHPNGDYMQLSIRENLFKKITPISIWYATDTAPGSSGSPVFNDQWQVVALHHMGVAKKNKAGKYIDKDGKVIPAVDGKIDASKVVWEANEGIRISVILKDLFASFADEPILNGLNVRPDEVAKRPEDRTNLISKNPVIDPANNNINISFPASLVERTGEISFNINQGTLHNIPPRSTSIGLPDGKDEGLILEEIKRLEQSTDFAACKGYQSRFLGKNHVVTFPQPQKSIRKFIAMLSGTDGILLKYHHYSVIFHSVRMMPIISGINVDGDPNKRKDESPRKDVWLRDTRLGFDIQLDDEYYRKSGFDRGHMSRREDANWGATPEEAKRNADLTCFYTNACPQVGKINQSSRKGLWGILEKVVLESGASLEQAQTAKISVFNGPIFKEDDPVFRGIQIPMDFFKIVLWLTDNGDLKATAFKLSQQGLVDDIDFEQLDLDQVLEFKAFQCSIKSLQKETKLDFSDLFKFDTFDGPEGGDLALRSELEVMAHISKHRKG
jgi:endonuclease G, mitochondrial